MNAKNQSNSLRTMRVIGCLAALSMLFTACNGAPAAGSKQADLIATAAIQTLTAMPGKSGQTHPTEAPTELIQAPVASATRAATATAAASPTPIIKPTLPLIASGPTNFAENIDPLTGLQASDPAILKRRPVLIKVSNWPADVRPQSGMSSADIVFEYYMGLGMNRFVALFYGQDASKVGSIRSGRLPDAQLGPLYQAVLASSGAYVTIERAIDRALGNRVINEGAGACPMFCRDSKISSPNNLFGSSSEITKFAKANGADPGVKQNLDGMAFDPATPASAKAGSQVDVVYNDTDKGEWRYDAASGKYLRWIDNQNPTVKETWVPLADANTNQQLAFSNVVVIFATYVKSADTVYDITLSTLGVGGKALVFRDGKVIEGTWKSQGATAPLAFFGADGKPLPFKPGNSWFAFMNTYSNATEKDGQWTVQMVIN